MSENKYLELAAYLATAIKDAAIMAAEEVLTETANVLTEAHGQFCDHNLDELANASLTGLKYTYKALDKVRSL